MILRAAIVLSLGCDYELADGEVHIAPLSGATASVTVAPR